jgi:hypothetical protein
VGVGLAAVAYGLWIAPHIRFIYQQIQNVRAWELVEKQVVVEQGLDWKIMCDLGRKNDLEVWR